MGRSLVNTNREILQLAVPSIITNITVPLLGLVDLAIVGHIGNETYIAAISVGTMIFNVMYWLCGFLRMGTSGMTAQAYGKGKKMQMELSSDKSGTTDEQSVIDKSEEGLRTTLHSSMRFAWMIALAMLLLQVPLQWLMLWLMGPSAEVDELVRVYFHICIWGAPAMLSLYVLTGWFIGMQDTRTPMIVSVMQNLVNIAMSLLFVIVFGMKIEGVALGTLVAQWCGALWAVIMLKKKYGWALKKTTDRIRMVSRRELRVNGDLFFRTFCLVAVNLFFTSAGARQGDLILSVNTLLMTFFTLFSYVMDGFAFAGEALAGKYYGANDDASLRKVWHHLFLWGGGITILFTAVYAMGGVGFLSLLTDSGNVVEASLPYFSWALLIPMAGVAAFIYDGIFIGITETRGMLIACLIASVVFFTLYYLLSPFMTNHALWLSLIVFLALRGIVQHLLFRRIRIKG